MKIKLGFSLIWYTITASVAGHLIILFLVPALISGSSDTYTLRDLTFLVEEIAQRPDKLSQDSEVKVSQDPTAPKNNPLSDEAVQKTTSATFPAGPLNKEGIVFNGKQVRKDSIPEPESTITVKEARAKLKELEHKIGNISDTERLAQIPEQKSYLEQVKEQLLQHYHVPRKAKYHGMTGEVVLQITIHQTGRLLDTKILRHSDFPVLDIAAEATVERAAPFPDISTKVDLPQITITVTFQYK